MILRFICRFLQSTWISIGMSPGMRLLTTYTPGPPSCTSVVTVWTACLPHLLICPPRARPLILLRPLVSGVVCLIPSWTPCAALISSPDDDLALLMISSDGYMELASSFDYVQRNWYNLQENHLPLIYKGTAGGLENVFRLFQDLLSGNMEVL